MTPELPDEPTRPEQPEEPEDLEHPELPEGSDDAEQAATPPSPDPALRDWLDDDGHHRRRRHTPPTGPIDRLRRKWRRWRRHRRRLARTAPWYRPRNISLGVLALLVLMMLTLVLSVYLKVNGVRRAPFLPLTAAPASAGTNLLLLASAAPAGSLTLDPNTLEVEFIHITANNQAGQVIDLPRDLVISTGGNPAVNTVQSLYVAGGVAGLVGALQNAMGLTINHALQTSFAGYAQVTRDLGTLEIQTDTGKQPFTATQAQAWMAEVNPAGGSIESGLRFQHWSKAMLQATLQPRVLLNPLKAWSVFSHTASNVIVDDTLDNSRLVGLVWRLRSLNPADLHFSVAPNAGYGQAGGQSVLLANATAFGQLSTAIRTDNLATLGLFQ